MTTDMAVPDWLKLKRQAFCCSLMWAYLASITKCAGLNGNKSPVESNNHCGQLNIMNRLFFSEKNMFCAVVIDPSRVKLPLTRSTQSIDACFTCQRSDARTERTVKFSNNSQTRKTAQNAKFFSRFLYLCGRHENFATTQAKIESG